MTEMPNCLKCLVPMRPGKALKQVWGDEWVTADFPGDYEGPDVSKAARGQTITSTSGRAKLIDCWKCPECGRSIEK